MNHNNVPQLNANFEVISSSKIHFEALFKQNA